MAVPEVTIPGMNRKQQTGGFCAACGKESDENVFWVNDLRVWPTTHLPPEGTDLDNLEPSEALWREPDTTQPMRCSCCEADWQAYGLPFITIGLEEQEGRYFLDVDGRAELSVTTSDGRSRPKPGQAILLRWTFGDDTADYVAADVAGALDKLRVDMEKVRAWSASVK